MHDDKLGVVDSRRELFDDPDSALGLRTPGGGIEAFFADQKATLDAQLAELKAKDGAPLVPRNQGAYDGIDARTRELQAGGLSHADATTQAIEESRTEREPEPERRDYLGSSVTDLMRQPVKSAGRGGSKGGRSRARTFPQRCTEPDCFLQYCDHPKGASARIGRPPIEDELRDAAIKTVRMSQRTLDAISEAGVSAADALMLFAIAYNAELPLDDVLTEWKAGRLSLPDEGVA